MHDIFTAVMQTGYHRSKRILTLGEEVILLKEPDNSYDSEAISCVVPAVGKIGYVINNFKTLPLGCFSAGRIYDMFKVGIFAETKFIINNISILKLNLESRNILNDIYKSSPFSSLF